MNGARTNIWEDSVTAIGLEGFAILEGLTPEESDSIGERCKTTRVDKDGVLFKEGESAHSLFFVRSGRIELRFVTMFYSSSIRISLGVATPGEVFGWSALIPPHRYTLRAHAMEGSELLQIKRADPHTCCEANIRLGYTVMKNIARLVSKRYELALGMLMREIQQGLKQKDPLV